MHRATFVSGVRYSVLCVAALITHSLIVLTLLVTERPSYLQAQRLEQAALYNHTVRTV